MKRIELLIPKAIDAVEKILFKGEKKEVPSEFNGYISSFGASLITSGLLPTIIFFSQDKKAGNRTAVIETLYEIINVSSPAFFTTQDGKRLSLVRFTKYMIEQNKNTAQFEQKLKDAAIALKLAIRIFPKAEKNT